MTVYAVITGDIVSNVIIAENKEETEKALNCVLVETTREDAPFIGMSYNQETNTFYFRDAPTE